MRTSVRTTLTLDDDLAMQLRQIAQRSGDSFKEVINSTLRRGLSRGDKPVPGLAPFRVEPKACGFRPGVDATKLNQLADELEMEDFRRELADDVARR